MYCYNSGYTREEVEGYVNGVNQLVRSNGSNFTILKSAVINDHMYERRDVDIYGSVGAAVCETISDYLTRFERIYVAYNDQKSLMPGHNVLTREENEELVGLVCFGLRSRIDSLMMERFVSMDYGSRGIERSQDCCQYVSLVISVLASFIAECTNIEVLSNAAFRVADKYFKKAFGVL